MCRLQTFEPRSVDDLMKKGNCDVTGSEICHVFADTRQPRARSPLSGRNCSVFICHLIPLLEQARNPTWLPHQDCFRRRIPLFLHCRGCYCHQGATEDRPVYSGV